MRALSKRESRVVAVGLLIAALLLFYLGIARPYVSTYRSYQQTVETLQERLARFQAIAATRDDVVRRLEQLHDDPQLARHYLQEESIALAAAELQQYVKRTIGDGGGRLVSTQSINTLNLAGVRSATIKVRMRGASDAILRVFHRLESSHPLVVLDNIIVQSTRRGRRARQGGENLDIRFDLTGYVRPAAS